MDNSSTRIWFPRFGSFAAFWRLALFCSFLGLSVPFAILWHRQETSAAGPYLAGLLASLLLFFYHLRLGRRYVVFDFGKQQVFTAGRRYLLPGFISFCAFSEIDKVFLNSTVQAWWGKDYSRAANPNTPVLRHKFHYGLGVLSKEGKTLKFRAMSGADYYDARNQGENLARALEAQWVSVPQDRITSVVQWKGQTTLSHEPPELVKATTQGRSSGMQTLIVVLFLIPCAISFLQSGWQQFANSLRSPAVNDSLRYLTKESSPAALVFEYKPTKSASSEDIGAYSMHYATQKTYGKPGQGVYSNDVSVHIGPDGAQRLKLRLPPVKVQRKLYVLVGYGPSGRGKEWTKKDLEVVQKAHPDMRLDGRDSKGWTAGKAWEYDAHPSWVEYGVPPSWFCDLKQGDSPETTLTSPEFSLDGASKPVLYFREMMGRDSQAKEAVVEASGDGAHWSKVDDIPEAEYYALQRFDLGRWKGKAKVRIRFRVKKGDYEIRLFVDSIVVTNDAGQQEKGARQQP